MSTPLRSVSAGDRGSDIINFKVIGIGTVCVVGAIVIAWLAHTAAGERLLREQQRLNSMAAESRALCEKWGTPAGSPKHAECLADIQKVRDQYARFIAEDYEPY